MLYSRWWSTQPCCTLFCGKKTWDVSFIAWKGLKELAAPVLYCIIKMCWKTDLYLLPVGFSCSVKKSIFFTKLCNALQHVYSTIRHLGIYEIKHSECVQTCRAHTAGLCDHVTKGPWNTHCGFGSCTGLILIVLCR